MKVLEGFTVAADARETAGCGAGRRKGGFTLLEALFALVLIAILGGAASGSLTAMVQRIKLSNAAEGVKRYALNARLRAISNPYRHCGLVFRTHASMAVDDTVISFLDEVADNLYQPGKDSLFLAPYVISKQDGIFSAIPAGYASTIVFRGDGSSNLSAKLVLTLKGFQDTLDVLASTGRVKVKAK